MSRSLSASNTLGTVVHETLCILYEPLQGEFLTTDKISSLYSKINDTVKSQFAKFYKKGGITKGKNLIIFEIAQRYVQNFIQQEIQQLKAGHNIKLIGVEKNLSNRFTR